MVFGQPLRADTPSKPLILLDKDEIFNPAPYCSTLLDETGTREVGDLREGDFSHEEKTLLNYGLTRSALWLDLSLSNRTVEENWVLDFDIHKFLCVEIYEEKEEGLFERVHYYRYDIPFKTRVIQQARLALPLTILPGSDAHYRIRVTSQNGLIFPLKISSEEQYREKSYRLNILWTFLYTLSTIIILYNLLIWSSIREWNYLLFVIYATVNLLYLSALNGLGSQYLWPGLDGPRTTMFSPFFGGITLAMGISLTRTFLNKPLITRGQNIYLNILTALSLLLTLSSLVLQDFMTIFRLGNIAGTIILLSIMAFGITYSFKGNKPAMLFLLSYLVIILGQLGYSLRAISEGDGAFWLLGINQFTPPIQTLLLSLALSYRITFIRKEKEEAQEAALKAEITLAETLEKKVNERTAELEEANRKLTELSSRDGLTGLYNRRYFDEQLIREWKRHQRTGQALSLILCDIDFFKKYNDTAGHLAGDDCLRQVAKIIGDSARRANDVPARYGGEEFAIILPQTDKEEAWEIGENMQNTTRIQPKPHPAFDNKNLTLSFGISTLVPRLDDSPQLLIQKADEALYRSKNSGRDRITRAD
ncbi:MAG: diguanylate cyclase [Spirochaetales bacterium]|nr:diguanylate cyclase [Spirochaetales bacterium]